MTCSRKYGKKADRTVTTAKTLGTDLRTFDASGVAFVAGCDPVWQVPRGTWERAMAVPDKRVDVTAVDQKTPRQASIRTGLSPTVEKMFGALVDGSDEVREDYVAEPEGKRAERLSPP